MPEKNRRVFLARTAAAVAAAFMPSAMAAKPESADLIRKAIPSGGERVPVIGLGSARRYEDASAADLPTLRETLQRFQMLGGRVVDTAPVYGTAEQTIGTLLEQVKGRESLFLATKISTRGGRDAGIKQVEQSFRNLTSSKIDLVAVHNLQDTEVHLETLRALKKAGRIRYVGLTTSFDRQYPEFEQVMRRETLDFIQIDYALDNRNAAERILPLARERGMAVMINLPFGRGRLFRATQGKPLPDWAREIGCTTWAQFFLKYIVGHEAVTCAIPGMARPEYVDDNMQAAKGVLPDAAMRRRMESFIDAL